MRLNALPLRHAHRHAPLQLLACRQGHSMRCSAHEHGRVRLAKGDTVPTVKRKNILSILNLDKGKENEKKSHTNICPLFSLNL